MRAPNWDNPSLRLLVDVGDSGEVNLKTGISMPQFCTHDEMTPD